MALTELINQYSAADLTPATTRTGSDEMGKEAFLNLLVTQLKNQDPLDPVKNEEFVAQLAQFNSLEQMINLNESYEKAFQLQQMAQATQLIGQPVGYMNAEGEFMSGVASTVSVLDGVPALQVGSDFVELEQIVALGQATSGSILAEASYLIGKQVEWLNADDTTETGVVESVEIRNGGYPVIMISGDDSLELALSEIISVSNP